MIIKRSIDGCVRKQSCTEVGVAFFLSAFALCCGSVSLPFTSHIENKNAGRKRNRECVRRCAREIDTASVCVCGVWCDDDIY